MTMVSTAYTIQRRGGGVSKMPFHVKFWKTLASLVYFIIYLDTRQPLACAGQRHTGKQTTFQKLETQSSFRIRRQTAETQVQTP